jgi:hypothetical protein
MALVCEMFAVMQWAITPLDTKVSVIKVKKSSLSMKEIITKFNIGKTQVYDTSVLNLVSKP